MTSHQKITIIGKLGRDPEMRYTPSGQAVTSFSVAVSEEYTAASGEAVKKTAWFRITTWGKQAESCNKYLKKRSLVYVEGRMDFDPATGGSKVFVKKDGTSGAALEVVASSVKFLTPKSESGEVPQSDSGGSSEEDEVPF